MRKLLPLLLLVSVIAFAACKPRAQRSGKGKSKVENTRWRGMDRTTLLKKHAATLLDYKYVNLKGKASFDNPAKNESMSFTYKISIARDSLIVANITKLGFPGAMMRIDPDSVQMRMPLDKVAIRCDLSYITRNLGFDADFAMIQELLLGDSKPLENSKLIPSDSSPVELRGKMSGFEVSWFLNGGDFKLEKMAVKDLNLARTSVLEYSDFQDVEGQSVPMQLNMEVTQSEPVRIELKHSNIDFDQDKANFKFRIPDSYEVKPCTLK